MGRNPDPDNARRYIWVNRWEEFQHYRDRDPYFIKNYTRLLRDDAYCELTPVQRAALHGIWLLFAAAHRKIPDSTSYVSRQLAMRITNTTLQALNHAGFIEFIASATLEQRTNPASAEKEKEKERARALPALRPVHPPEHGTNGPELIIDINNILKDIA